MLRSITHRSIGPESRWRKLRFGSATRVLLLSAAGILGITGIVAALQHYYRRDIPKTGSEQRMNVQIEAPYGSVDIKAGAPQQAVASIVIDGDSNDAPALHFSYAIRNHAIGILRIGVGTDEGALDEPMFAWRASTPGFSYASANAMANTSQSDLGRPFTGGANPLGYPPISRLGQPKFKLLVTDAGTVLVAEAPPANTGITKIALTRDIPMFFGADLGFGESNVDLTGLALINSHIETGASKANISVNQPNPISMGTCSVSAGLGECTFNGISNLNASNFSFNGGVGSYRLGFEGKLSKNLDASVQLGLGRCTISIPADAGRVQVFYDDGLLSSYNFLGLSRRRDGYATSAGFDHSGSPILTLHLSSGMGKMTVIYH